MKENESKEIKEEKGGRDFDTVYLELFKEVLENIKKISEKNPGVLVGVFRNRLSFLRNLTSAEFNKEVRHAYLRFSDIYEPLRFIINRRFQDIVQDRINEVFVERGSTISRLLITNIIEELIIPEYIGMNSLIAVDNLQDDLDKDLKRFEESERVKVLDIIAEAIEKSLEKIAEVESELFSKVYNPLAGAEDLNEFRERAEKIYLDLDREALTLLMGIR